MRCGRSASAARAPCTRCGGCLPIVGLRLRHSGATADRQMVMARLVVSHCDTCTAAILRRRLVLHCRMCCAHHGTAQSSIAARRCRRTWPRRTPCCRALATMTGDNNSLDGSNSSGSSGSNDSSSARCDEGGLHISSRQDFRQRTAAFCRSGREAPQ